MPIRMRVDINNGASVVGGVLRNAVDRAGCIPEDAVDQRARNTSVRDFSLTSASVPGKNSRAFVEYDLRRHGLKKYPNLIEKFKYESSLIKTAIVTSKLFFPEDFPELFKLLPESVRNSAETTRFVKSLPGNVDPLQWREHGLASLAIMDDIDVIRAKCAKASIRSGAKEREIFARQFDGIQMEHEWPTNGGWL